MLIGRFVASAPEQNSARPNGRGSPRAAAPWVFRIAAVLAVCNRAILAACDDRVGRELR